MPRWRWKSGRVSRRQAERVAAVLGAAPAGALRVLALHHPPFARGAARLAGRGRLAAGLLRARVDVVLAGHTHVPRSREVTLGPSHSLVEVTAGTATSRRTRGHARSWTAIGVTAEAIVVENRDEDGGAWRTGRVERYRRAR
jgi:3',5'-cyclic AMP phosphodiesterase CpdA